MTEMGEAEDENPLSRARYIYIMYMAPGTYMVSKEKTVGL